MAFNREWRQVNGGYEYIPNRDRTGPPTPPPTGRTVQEGGVVIVADQNVQPQIPPARPVKVNFPGPNEPIVGKDGRITPRWWRFLDELYRRTGGPVDNINKAPITYLPTGAPASLALTGYVPTVSVTTNVKEFPTLGSIALTGQALTIVNTS